MIKYILIDIDDTLLDFQLCSRASIASVCKETGIPYSEELMRVFHKTTRELWDKIELATLTRQELAKIRFNKIFSELNIVYDGECFEELYCKALYESDISVDGARELLAWLSERFTVCAASNAPYAQQENRLKKAGLLPYFTHLFVSESIGVQKPAREFFEYALNILEAAPDEVLMIGDSMSADITGAVNAGIHTCLFNRKKDTPTGDILPEYQVKRLIDITELSLLA